MKVILREKDSNKVDHIEIEKITRVSGAPTKVSTRISFEIRNNKCTPKIGKSTIDVNGNNIVTTIFDTSLCKELEEYFKEKENVKSALILSLQRTWKWNHC